VETPVLSVKPVTLEKSLGAILWLGFFEVFSSSHTRMKAMSEFTLLTHSTSSVEVSLMYIIIARA